MGLTTTHRAAVRLLIATALALLALATPTTAAAAVETAERQSRFVGTWAGRIDQPGADPYRVKVTILRAADGFRANVKYPQLLCGGVWNFQGKEGRTLRFVEDIRYNGVCGSGVDVSVKARADGSLDYRFDTPTAYGTGVLSRVTGRPVGPGNKEAGHGLKQWPTDQDESSPGLMIWFGAAWRTGNWDIGLPSWVSCIEQDICLAGAGLEVGVVERGDYGFFTVDEFSVDMPARYWLRRLGYDAATINALLT